jgi:hypothetical protein
MLLHLNKFYVTLFLVFSEGAMKMLKLHRQAASTVTVFILQETVIKHNLSYINIYQDYMFRLLKQPSSGQQ